MAAWVRSRLNSASRLLFALARLCWRLLLRNAGELVANLRQLQAALLQDLRRETFLFAQ